MKRFWILFRHEILRLLLGVPMALLGFLFLLCMSSLFLWVLRSYEWEASFQSPWLATLQLYWIPTLFLVPVLGISAISLPREHGLLEVLFTAPVRPIEYIMAKFLALWMYFLSLWLCFFVLVGVTSWFLPTELPVSFFSVVEFFGGLYFFAIVGALYIALALMVASMVRSLALSAFLTLLLLFAWILGPQLLLLKSSLWQKNMESFLFLREATSGIIDMCTLVLYLSLTLLFLGSSALFLRIRSR